MEDPYVIHLQNHLFLHAKNKLEMVSIKCADGVSRLEDLLGTYVLADSCALRALEWQIKPIQV